MKVYNTFRNRWCGAYLQSKGIRVIPTVTWGEPNTFWFCFDGIEQGSVVAVSTLGVRKEKSLFMQGYNELIRKIKPSAVICYGKPFEEMKGNIIPIDYEKTNNLKQFAEKPKIFVKKSNGYVFREKGMGMAGSISGGSSSIQIIDKKDLPENVRSSYQKYEEHDWKGTYEGQTPGTKAGSKWNNTPPELPEFDDYGNNITYQEFDVNNKLEGSLRDAERFVRGSDGRLYYSPDHYETFYEIK